VKQIDGRARRFELDVFLRYRPIGATAWQEGRTENISGSGVLFLADQVMDVDTRVEMTFALPVTGPSGQVVCRGRVIRIVQPGEDEPRPGLAATISRATISPPGTGEPPAAHADDRPDGFHRVEIVSD
jgi:hypothetical protein